MISFLLPFLLTVGLISFPCSVAAGPTPPSPPHDPQQFLQLHNNVRHQHNASDLEWSTDWAEKAATWANRCHLENTNDTLSDQGYGENIVAATGKFTVDTAFGTFTSDTPPNNQTLFTHFSQVVWKSTTQLGCGAAACNDLFPGKGVATMYVCFYYPAGNVRGQYEANVQL